MTPGPPAIPAILHPPRDVDGAHDVADVRRLAVATANALDFGPDDGRVAIVATELATNLVKYARQGRVLVRAVQWQGISGVDLVSVDRGPGMADVAAHLADGYSTGGTLGGGLGAITRLSDLFDIYSRPGLGTVAFARLWRSGLTPPADRRFRVGTVAEAFPGETVSGDGWAVEQRGSRLVALLADGLGHGATAAEAAQAAVDAFRLRHIEPVEVIVAEIHRALRGTRGAAVAVAEIDRAARRLRFCGLGNIAGRVLGGPSDRSLVSHYGIAGFEARRIEAFEASWPAGGLMVMHSDGFSPRWSIDACPGLDRRHPLLVAATVARDAPRRHDDATVLAIGEA